MTETNITNSQLYELAKEMWNSLEDHRVGQEERGLELKAEIEKVREAQGALGTFSSPFTAARIPGR
jgi:hypothetical protein